MVAVKGLLKAKQVCEILGISRMTLWRICKRNELQPIRLKGMCRGLRFTQDVLESYLARSRRKPQRTT